MCYWVTAPCWPQCEFMFQMQNILFQFLFQGKLERSTFRGAIVRQAWQQADWILDWQLVIELSWKVSFPAPESLKTPRKLLIPPGGKGNVVRLGRWSHWKPALGAVLFLAKAGQAPCPGNSELDLRSFQRHLLTPLPS